MKKLFILFAMLIMIVPFQVNAESTLVYSETIDSIDGIRYENYLVYFSDKGEDLSGANGWGYEVAVDKNMMVVETGTNVFMVRDGFILSAHGTKKTALMDVEIGDVVDVDLEAMTVNIYHDSVRSAYLKSLRYQEVARSCYDVALENYITVNKSDIEYEIEKIETAISRMTVIYNSENIETALATELISLAYDVEKRTEKVMYMTTKTRTVDIRAVWHRPNSTSIKENNLQGIINLLDKFQEIGINTIYLETFWNGFSSGRSDILDTHPNLASYTYGEEYGNDYLKAFITEANKRSIDVHAWVHTFNAGNSTNLSSAVKSEWLVEDYQGRTLHPNAYGGSYYLDPSNQEVLDFALSMLEELVQKYEFKGIQLDYIRYYDNNYNLAEIRDSGYGEGPNQRFLDAYDLEGDVRTLILDSNIRLKWNEWRQGNITNAVKYFTTNLRELNPNIVISADVVGDITNARNTYMQDWLTWVNLGYIDLLCPMIYTTSNTTLSNTADQIYEQLSNNTLLSSGIAPLYYGDTVSKQIEQIVIASKTGGSAIFASHNIIGNIDAEKALRDGTFRNPTVSPFDDMDVIVDTVMGYLEGFINDNVEDVTLKNMFLGHVEKIDNLEVRNPGEYKIAYDKVKFMRDILPYISDETIRQVINDELLTLEHVLDTRITRELISLGLYNPENEDSRPDPLSFTYEIDDEDDDNDLPGDNNSNPGDGTEDITPEENNSVLPFVISGIVLLVSVIFLSIHSIYKRRA